MRNESGQSASNKPDRLPVWFAVLSMLLQVVFTAEHASASAAATALGGSQGTPVGFLQICTADGLVQLDPRNNDGSPPRRGANGGEACAICGAAAVSGATQAPGPSAAALLPVYGPPAYGGIDAGSPLRSLPAKTYLSRAPPVLHISFF